MALGVPASTTAAATTGLFGAGGQFAAAQAIPTILAIGGTGLAAAGQIRAGREEAAAAKFAGRVAETEAISAQNIANYNAAVQRREAEAIKQRTRFGQKRQAEKAKRVKSALVSKIASAGGLGSPVAADLAAEQAAELELENLLIGYEGAVAESRALSQADLDELSGRLARGRGRTARETYGIRAKTVRRAAYRGAGTTLLTGFSSALEA
jgi:hypothetical protein